VAAAATAAIAVAIFIALAAAAAAVAAAVEPSTTIPSHFHSNLRRWGEEVVRRGLSSRTATITKTAAVLVVVVVAR
jgi:hypothetical protein